MPASGNTHLCSTDQHVCLNGLAVFVVFQSVEMVADIPAGWKKLCDFKKGNQIP
jgi:hypothetical protein